MGDDDEVEDGGGERIGVPDGEGYGAASNMIPLVRDAERGTGAYGGSVPWSDDVGPEGVSEKKMIQESADGVKIEDATTGSSVDGLEAGADGLEDGVGSSRAIQEGIQGLTGHEIRGVFEESPLQAPVVLIHGALSVSLLRLLLCDVPVWALLV